MELFGQRPELDFGSSVLHHWNDYFVVVGTTEEKENLFLNDRNTSKRVPAVLARMPEKDVPGYPLPDQVPMV